MSEVTLYCGDCLDVMRQFEDGQFVAVVTDPPYGIAICRNEKLFGADTKKSRKATSDIWDDKPVDDKHIRELMRVSKDQIVFGANYFWESFHSSPCYIIWDKRGDLPDVPFSPVEFAWSSFKKMPRRYVIRNHGFIRDSKDERTGHPTQKPSELMIAILEDFTKSGDTILDPFMGSGTTGVACVQTGRNFVGIEIDKGYFEIAQKRIEEAQMQMRMAI